MSRGVRAIICVTANVIQIACLVGLVYQIARRPNLGSLKGRFMVYRVTGLGPGLPDYRVTGLGLP